MNYENIQLKGVTRKPDDSLSSNGELAVALDLVHDGDGLRTGEQPAQLFATSGKSVIFIHQNASYKHYISYVTANNVTTLYYRVGTSGTDTAIHTLTGGITAISSVGNTIIVNDGTGLNYILWDATQQTYRFLGQKPPFTGFQFGLHSEFESWPDKNTTTPSFERDVDGRVIPIPRYGANDYWVKPEIIDDDQNFKDYTYSLENRTGNEGSGPVESTIADFTQWTMSYINSFIQKLGTEKNRFVFPFFVRYAYELYDGSLIMHSHPIMMIPNSQGPIFGLYTYHGLKLNKNDGYDDNERDFQFRGRAYGFTSELMNLLTYRDSSLQDWKDIIKGINIYVTPPVYTHDQDGKVFGWTSTSDPEWWKSRFTIGAVYSALNYIPVTLKEAFEHELQDTTAYPDNQDNNFFAPRSIDGTSFRYPCYCMTLPMRTKSEINKALADAAQFFCVSKITFDELMAKTVYSDNRSEFYQAVKMEEHVVSTLTSQTQMVNDYFSHDTLASSVLYPYNRRLNLGGVIHTLKAGVPASIQFMHRYDPASEKGIRIAFYLKKNGKEYITVPIVESNKFFSAEFPHYIFYPDPDAYKAVIHFTDDNTSKNYSVPLTKHNYLHGAFWLGDITNPYDHIQGTDKGICVQSLLDSSITSFPSQSSDLNIDEFNLVYTSEAENPFVFTPENVNAVGDGRILALCSNTTMLSHEVFGREPMYVFTEQGVWPMTVGTTGVFTSVQMPNVRDVILPGTKPLPITQGILFLTKRGLLAMQGNSVKVVSEDINNDFLAEFDKLTELVTTIFNASYAAKVSAFTDFRNDSATARLAYDYRNQRVYVALGNGCWVLNLKSTLWTQSSTVIGTPLNSFPDCEFSTGNSVYTIGSARKDTGLLLTRPVKTGSEFYANIKEMAARGNFSINNAPVITALFGTRNYINNYLLKSSTRPRITRFGGSPFKAHSFFAAIKNPSALVNMADKTYIDRFVIGIDTFQRNKLR